MRATRTERGATLIVVAAIAAAVALSPSTALAAFPGKNGRIAYVEARPGGGTDVFTILPDGSGVQLLANAGSEPSWSADGRELVFSRLGQSGTSQVLTVSVDGGEPTLVVDAGSPVPPLVLAERGPHPLYDGLSIRTIRTDGTEPRTVLTAGRGGFDEAVFSLSGRRIVFVGQPEGGKPGIWSMRRDGSHRRRLTSNSRDYAPDYSPDARHIVYARYGSPNVGAGIHVMRADGSHRRLIPHTHDAGSPAYAPAAKG